MRIVIQRVTKASVTAPDNYHKEIGNGLLVLLGIGAADDQSDIEWLTKKLVSVRIFDDENGVMNLSVKDVQGEILLISQFTLLASSKKGNRPSYLEAASPDISIPLYNNFTKMHPLVAKEQARKYAKTVGAQYVILSNGIVHYFWDVTKGNPKPIYKFPSPNEIGAIKAWNPDRNALANEKVAIDYIASIQMPDYAERPEWKGTPEASKDFVWTNGLRFLRRYQLKAIEALQSAVAATSKHRR